MTTTLLTVIGILIAALGTVAGFVYYEMDSGSALEGSIAISQGVVSLSQTAASFREANGGQPQSLDDLKSVADLPQLPKFSGTSWAVRPASGDNGFVCLFAERSKVADRSVRDAQKRLGSKAIVSGDCGVPGDPGRDIVLSYPMAS